MITRCLVAFLALAFIAMNAHAQTGFFGPLSSNPKAGDFAPEVSIEKILSAPANTTWKQSNLFGQITLLTFLPNISFNLQVVMGWNALIDKFTGKPVQFVCLTQEKESSSLPFLAEHPLKGFLLFDSSGATGRVYGLERPAAVIIGADGRIIGFDSSIMPTADTVNAALEGRITTTPLKPGAAEFKAFIQSHKVLLDAQGPRLPSPDENKPDFPPSYTVHISPSERENGTANFGGDSWQTYQGYDLKRVISELYGINPIRIELPASLDDGKRYDFSLVLPERESHEKMLEFFRQGIQDHFYLRAVTEQRLMGVYVVTATDRRPPAPAVEQASGFIKQSTIGLEAPYGLGDPYEFSTMPKVVGIRGMRGISVEGTVDEFCQTLERRLDRPVVNETNLRGEFAFNVEASPTGKNDFIARLRDELGLVIESTQRSVKILVFNPR